MDSTKLKSLIAEVDEEMRPLLEMKASLSRQLMKAESEDFIRANKITKSNVQHCDGDDLPRFGIIYKFGEWCEKFSDKPWCCWNGALYQTSEIIRGRIARDAPGRYEDLPTEEPQT